MGQASVTPTHDIRSKLNFSGIKELKNHPYLSCICSQTDPTHLSNSGAGLAANRYSNSSSHKSQSKFKFPSSSSRISFTRNLGCGGIQSPGLQLSTEEFPQTSHQKIKSYTPNSKDTEWFFNPSRTSSNRNSSFRYSKKKNPILEKLGQKVLDTVFEGEKTAKGDAYSFIEQVDLKELEGSQAASHEIRDVVEDQMDSVIKEEVLIADGRRYRGDLLNGVPHGIGKETWPDNSTYEGMFHFGTRTGEGVFIWSDKSIYRGNFIDNEMQGFGIFEWPNGNRYEGMWSRSKMHGEGKYFWNNGNQYAGSYANGLKHGEGTFTYQDGRVVKGKWISGHIQLTVSTKRE